MPSFSSLGLIDLLCRALDEEGYQEPTPVQLQAIPPLLKGQDVLACAQTGTGKTAAFALPVLQLTNFGGRPRGKRHISTLVLTPTRELAAQIGESFQAYGRHVDVEHLVIFGGVNERPQIKSLRSGQEVLVATPGRLLDLMGRGFVHLDQVDFFVLDEADRMLDMGFVHDVRRVLAVLPEKRQNLLFSATMPPAIVELAGSFLTDPVHIEVTPESTTVERIEQRVCFVKRSDKVDLLARLLRQEEVTRAIVFTRTKHGANRLGKKLARFDLRAEAIHGNKSQGARRRALEGFRNGSVPVLVATDIASRGIDVDDVSHVFNYDLPNEPESYVHRIGRTGRAGREGVAISFCDESEGAYLRAIEGLIRQEVPVDREHPYHHEGAVPPAAPPPRSSGRGSRGSGRGGSRGGGRGGSRNGSRGGSRGGNPGAGGDRGRNSSGGTPGTGSEGGARRRRRRRPRRSSGPPRRSEA